MKKKKKKKNGHAAIVVSCLVLLAYMILGYSKKFKEMEVAQKMNVTFEEDESSLKQTASSKTTPKDDGIPKLTWKELEGLDHMTGRMSPQIQILHDQTVKIPGYIVPLTDDLEFFNEFLIVPTPQACIHFPPPPPNQMFYVKTKKNLPISITFYPFWFQGKLEAVSTISEFGKVSYKLTLQKLEAYK